MQSVLRSSSKDSAMTALLSSLLTQLVLGFAAMVSGLTEPEPAPLPDDALLRAPHAVLVVEDAAERLEVRRCNGEGPCRAARMRWQITLAGPSLRRCGETCSES
jgi:hypothetical protein